MNASKRRYSLKRSTGWNNTCEPRGLVVALAAVAHILTACPSSSPAPVSPPGLRPVTLYSAQGGKSITVYAEVADTDLTRQRGLMGRTELAPDRGMLFLFQYESYQTFWMKDTPLSLDMIFITAKKTVAGCVERTEPFSTQRYTVPTPVQYVLEMPAGFCNQHAIGKGTRVEF